MYMFTVLPNCVTDVISGWDWTLTDSTTDSAAREMPLTSSVVLEPLPNTHSAKLFADVPYSLPPNAATAVVVLTKTWFSHPFGLI